MEVHRGQGGADFTPRSDSRDRDEEWLAGQRRQYFRANDAHAADQLTETTRVKLDDGRGVFAMPGQRRGQGFAGVAVVL